MIPAYRPLLMFALVAAPVWAAKPPKIPKDAPYCAPAGMKPVFLSPMGEPFRGTAGQPYPAAAWFAGADSDHDGAVSRGEFVRDAERFFRTIDLDHDGRITPEEVIAYERDVAPEIALYSRSRDYLEVPTHGKPKAGQSNYGGAMGAGRYAWLNVPEPVVSADTDFNRVIDEEEFRQAASRRFDTLAGGEGKLLPAAMPRTPIQIAIEGPCRPRPKPKQGPGGDRRDGPPDSDDRARGEGAAQ
ncbi:EF-hand domain-containing protein [Sphingomonas sp.]|uniref:EF-hand domain-containing protein n=1 Tax=Sphingomonas sp. TaxID=28214 RepID=UPI000DB0D468|nr:EF-hand domain-containing protein [Sphingomonas sp.]PZU09219.1 MAG: hypothetical protein DI605_10700 [Sphingomonas sp.]